MPRYDYTCTSGHTFESIEDRETSYLLCACGEGARRTISLGHVPGAIGFTPKPTREHYVNVGRAVEASAELAHQAERAHVQLPDLWKVARDRVARGDAVAIE